MTSVRPLLLLCGVGLIAAARAAALDLPVRYPDREPLTAPAYRGDALLITLAPAASAEARRARPPAAAESARPAAQTLGLAGVDRLAATLGGARFERVFAGEAVPVAGSDEPDFTAFFRVHLPPGTVLEEALERFGALPEVASAEPIAVLRVSATPNDSVWTEAWWYHGATGGIRAPQGWDVTTGDTSIVIAIVDTGVLPYHPDLGGTNLGLTGQLWNNWVERGGIPGFDDDGNGKVDDVAGWDFVDLPTPSGVAEGEDWDAQDNDPSDFAGHGTRVAGIAGALTHNSIGIAGTAWNVRLMPLRMGWAGSTPGNLGIVDMTFAAAAIRYATRMGATVINCSFETLLQGDLSAAATAAVRAGITIVCSAGNTGQVHELQDRIDVISVTANGSNDVISSSALRGSYVDLTAPGVSITTTALLPTGVNDAGPRLPSYATSTGTSYSAPFVAGAAALVQARQKALGDRPLGALTMMFRMRETADDVSAMNPGLTGYGSGRLNLLRALTEPPTSYARRVGALMSGPAVVLPALSGRPRMAFATADRRVLLLDAQTADSLAVATLPAAPARQVAAADMGGGRGLCLFVGLMQGRVAGFDDRLRALPGWPVTGPGSLYRFDAGPALGDLDGDGVLEVVCGSDNGEIWAWRVDGSVVDGFPVASGSMAQTGPVALNDLDGLPGVEIVAANRDGGVTVFRSDGGALAGWPVAAGATTSPIVVSLGASGTSVVVGAGSNVKAYAPNGAARWSAPVPGGTLAQDPAAGDLDGDGVDEIVAATPAAIALVDALGNTPITAGWPRTLTAAPAGPVLIGRLQAGPRPGVYFSAGGTQVALDHLAQPLGQFPKQGVPGITPALADLDGDGRTEMIAGTAPDSTLFVYDAGAETWGAGEQSWGTPRANFARTGSRLYSPSIGVVDDVPPATVTGLGADSALAGEVVLKWTAPGDDGASGTASDYQIQMTTRAESAGDFASGAITVPPPPAAAGTPQRHVVRGLAPNTRYFFALRARDDAGNWSAASNVAAVLTPRGRPGPPRPEGIALAARFEPGVLPIDFDWWAPAAAGASRAIDLYDVGGRRVRRIPLPAGDEGVAAWDGKDDGGRRAPAGLYFARLTSGSLRAQARVVLIP